MTARLATDNIVIRQLSYKISFNPKFSKIWDWMLMEYNRLKNITIIIQEFSAIWRWTYSVNNLYVKYNI